MHEKKVLDKNNSIGTLLQTCAGGNVDATTQKLVSKLAELERVRWNADREIRAINTALSLAGVKPGKIASATYPREHEYASSQVFAEMGLREACEKVLEDFEGQWLSKAEIEYLIARGGYPFTTKNSKNSVGITLQRLATEEFCEVERKRGATGNRYRFNRPVLVFDKPK
jgi:hypothetical protein